MNWWTKRKRNKIALEAMKCIIAKIPFKDNTNGDDTRTTMLKVANGAYGYADAMLLAERNTRYYDVKIAIEFLE